MDNAYCPRCGGPHDQPREKYCKDCVIKDLRRENRELWKDLKAATIAWVTLMRRTAARFAP